MYKPELELMAVVETLPSVGSDTTPGWVRWLGEVISDHQKACSMAKPDWAHVPDRVWRRNSALLISLREVQEGERLQ